MRNQVRIGILGCANIAKKYAIQAFQNINNARVISIASRSREKAKKFANQFSIPAYESYENLLRNPQVDAVYIPLPVGLHKKWIIKAIKAGKHIISEKSLATDFQSAKEIIDAAKNAKTVLYEDFMCDFHPQHQKVLSLIANGEIGKPFLFRSYFCIPMMDKDNFRYNKNLGGSSLYEVGWYPVFMARKILRAEPVYAMSHLLFDKKTGIDMAGSAQLIFKNGIAAHLVFSLDSLYQNVYSILGTKGMINSKMAHTIAPDKKPQIEIVKNSGFEEFVKKIKVEKANHFELIYKDFCQTILEKNIKRKELVYEKILAQAKVLEAIKISSQQNRQVKIEEIN